VDGLTLCDTIAEIARRRAGGRVPVAVEVRIGALREIVPDNLRFCWTVMVEGTDLASTVLQVEQVAARVRCHDCDAETDLPSFGALTCSVCGGGDVAVTAGREFDVAAPVRAGAD